MSAALNYSDSWGGPLTESDYRSLAARWITANSRISAESAVLIP